MEKILVVLNISLVIGNDMVGDEIFEKSRHKTQLSETHTHTHGQEPSIL